MAKTIVIVQEEIQNIYETAKFMTREQISELNQHCINNFQDFTLSTNMYYVTVIIFVIASVVFLFYLRKQHKLMKEEEQEKQAEQK